MKIVGLTGGIGSGKTTVAKMFETFGIPVYIADFEAKLLMNRSKIIKRKLKQLLGDEAYVNDTLHRPFVAQKIFHNKQLLNEVNAIVHPKVASHFKRWLKKQTAVYVIKEVAILFENDSYKECDFTITITASKEDRLRRVVKRDNSSEERVTAIMNNQWSDEQRIELSDFVIENTDINETRRLAEKVHLKILKSIV
ncbi:MAG: dephospho-CoA kinase [Flavobacteriaceae bacterium]|nr:dephospho-CoA kinase [Flavobacteriaceae bacterium]